MSNGDSGSGFQPAEYTTFEKVQQLIAMASRDEHTRKELLSGEEDQVKRAFARAGLGEDEVDQAIELIDKTFDSNLREALRRPW